MSRYSEKADGSLRHVVGLLTSQNVTWWYQASVGEIQDRELLIRGFGVRVPGGAPVIEALTWRFFPDQSRFHVHSGRSCAPCVLRAPKYGSAPLAD